LSELLLILFEGWFYLWDVFIYTHVGVFFWTCGWGENTHAD